MPPFEKLLAVLFKLVTAASKKSAVADNPLFCDGDAEHLARWLEYPPGAEKIRQNIFKEPFDFVNSFNFIISILRLRRGATTWDRVNRELPIIERKAARAASEMRRRATRMLTNSEMTPEQYAELITAIKGTTVRLTKFINRAAAVRSDGNGTRRRTLFCRTLSEHLHARTGRWHDTEVAALCEIALDCGPVTIEMVRSARRESTRKRRQR
jgi:hypothetical protein